MAADRQFSCEYAAPTPPWSSVGRGAAPDTIHHSHHAHTKPPFDGNDGAPLNGVDQGIRPSAPTATSIATVVSRAPEDMISQTVCAPLGSNDMWSLGITLFRMLTRPLIPNDPEYEGDFPFVRTGFDKSDDEYLENLVKAVTPSRGFAQAGGGVWPPVSALLLHDRRTHGRTRLWW